MSKGDSVYALLSSDQLDFKTSVDDLATSIGVQNPDDLSSRDFAEGWAVIAKNGLLELRLRDDGAPVASGVEIMVATQALAERLAPQPYLPSGALAVELLEIGGAETSFLASVSSGSRLLAVALEPRLTGLARAEPGSQAVLWGGFSESREAITLVETADGTRVGIATVSSKTSPDKPFALTQQLHPVAVESVQVVADMKVEDSALTRWTGLALTGLCADSVGLMRSALHGAVEYSKVRVAYGKAIGTFQALQHLAADTYTMIDAAYGATCHAAWAVDGLDADEALIAARVAKAYTDSVTRDVTENVMQIYGGIGQTWEHIAHFYTRRALLNTHLLGNESQQLDALAAHYLGGN